MQQKHFPFDIAPLSLFNRCRLINPFCLYQDPEPFAYELNGFAEKVGFSYLMIVENSTQAILHFHPGHCDGWGTRCFERGTRCFGNVLALYMVFFCPPVLKSQFCLLLIFVFGSPGVACNKGLLHMNWKSQTTSFPTNTSRSLALISQTKSQMHSRPMWVMPYSPLSPNNFWPLQRRTAMNHRFLRPSRPLLEQYAGLISGEHWVSDPPQHSDLQHHDLFKWFPIEIDILCTL